MGSDRRLMVAIAALLLLVAGGSGVTAGTGSVPHAIVESPPAVTAAEVDRVRLHLGNVESALRARGTGGLGADQRARRAVALDWLREYRERGLFPHNHTHSGQRVPVFVDEHGTHCAVGYLLKRSGETELINAVVAADNNVRVRELADNARFRNWLEETGLTLEEAAWIQPRYGTYPPGYHDRTPEEDLFPTLLVGIASGGLAIYSHASQPGPGYFQVTGVLNAVAGLLHAGMAVRIGARRDLNPFLGVAINSTLSLFSGCAAVSRFLRSRDQRVALRAETRDEEPNGESVVHRRFQVSLPEPAWIHGRLGIQFRAVH